jgi:hypothetical protein
MVQPAEHVLWGQRMEPNGTEFQLKRVVLSEQINKVPSFK